jgi:hypothetical protein
MPNQNFYCMPESFERGRTRIKYEGIFDWKEFYNTFIKYFFDKKFDFYEGKNVRKPGTYGYEIEYEAHAEREESGYVRHDIDVRIKGFHMEDIEVIENGKKVQRTKAGMIIVDLIPKLVLDWQNRWDKKFKKSVRGFFHKYLLEGYINEQLDKLVYETYKLNTMLKEVMQLEGRYTAYK